jgi:ribosome-binding protein aMBF1 (putative translation factor)
MVGDNMARMMKPMAYFLEEKGMSIVQLAAASGLEVQRVKAIAEGNYTASPSDRRRLAEALAVLIEEIAWGHTVPVEHLRGNGPQCGRST